MRRGSLGSPVSSNVIRDTDIKVGSKVLQYRCKSSLAIRKPASIPHQRDGVTGRNDLLKSKLVDQRPPTYFCVVHFEALSRMMRMNRCNRAFQRFICCQLLVQAASRKVFQPSVYVNNTCRAGPSKREDVPTGTQMVSATTPEANAIAVRFQTLDSHHTSSLHLRFHVACFALMPVWKIVQLWRA